VRGDEAEAAIWQALSHACRRRILDLVRRRPRKAGELAAAFEGELSRPAVVRHVGILQRAGLVVLKKEGREVIHHYSGGSVRAVLTRWLRGETRR
jgi:DNA-binding transcriptional ArsR family regulator